MTALGLGRVTTFRLNDFLWTDENGPESIAEVVQTSIKAVGANGLLAAIALTLILGRRMISDGACRFR